MKSDPLIFLRTILFVCIFSLVITNPLVFGQAASNQTEGKLIIAGMVTGKSSGNKTDTLAFTRIQLKGTRLVTSASIDGTYKMDLTEFMNSPKGLILEFSYLGYATIEIQVPDNNPGELKYNPVLNQINVLKSQLNYSKPTFRQRVRARFK